MSDSKHYTDDEIAKIQASQNVALSNMATKNEVSTIDGKLTAHISESDAKFETLITKEKVNELLDGCASKEMVSNVANECARLDNALSAKANSSDVYTKSEVDDKIADIDVTDQLANYYDKNYIDNLASSVNTSINAKLPIDSFNEWSENVALKSQTTCIKDENGKVITEMVIDNSNTDDSVEVYTKEQCDERFAKVWSGTETQYNAITNKDNNTIYIIL